MLCSECHQSEALVHLSKDDLQNDAQILAQTVHVGQRFHVDKTIRVDQVVHLCEACAWKVIQSAPKRTRLTFCADWRINEDKQKVSRHYRVLEHFPTTNQTKLERFPATAGLEGTAQLTVRTDLIPEGAREVGTDFALGGSPLEIEIFETWGGSASPFR